MQSDYDTAPRFLAFAPAILGQMPAIMAAHASDLPEVPLDANSPLVRCIAGGRDQQADPLILRALRLGKTAIPQNLSDGRMAFCGFWTLSVLSAVQSGDIAAQEITEAEYLSLLPASEEP